MRTFSCHRGHAPGDKASVLLLEGSPRYGECGVYMKTIDCIQVSKLWRPHTGFIWIRWNSQA